MTRSRARAGLGILVIACLLPAPAAPETVHGRVTFVGTLGEERQPDGTMNARFRFRLSESACGNTTDGLWTRNWNGTAWSAWQQVSPDAIASDPAAVYRTPARIDVFALGTDRHMYTGRWDGSHWSGWELVGNDGTTSFSSGPAAAFEPGNNWIHLFARGMNDNALWINQWRGTWSGWTRLAPEEITLDPAAVSWGQNRIDVFARGKGDKMYWIFWNGTGWSSWAAMGPETFTSGPGVASWGANRLDLFARRSDNALWANAWNGTTWTGWQQASPAPIGSDPAAVSVSVNRVDVFARGTDNQMYTIVREGTQWSGWTSLGAGRFGSGPAAVSLGNQVHLFARGNDRVDRWFHVTSGRMDSAFAHNAANFRNAYNTLLSAFLARSVVNVQVDGVPNCDESQTFALPQAQIGLHP